MNIFIPNIRFYWQLTKNQYKINCQKTKKAGWPHAKPAFGY